ncbi:cytidylyltransferase domain-containing protein [Metabacillus bambusae]|uniref:Glycosyltransferase family protein n=1 Tax=Metabacillus bambusae TaxID=2795218 RepID=A0ABS3N5K1_9BACI|nr:glycosyltransferase family protein [Metabacillus bambusae]MBO1513356.1 glycosyltransferase family protein [Metabacillus bambusae]
MILAIIQARMSSKRFPGKVLKPILGVPMLLRQIERVKCASLIDQLVIATSEEPSDDPIAQLCLENNILSFRGSLDNVLDRFYKAAKPFSPEHVVRLTGDCPLIDPELINKIIKYHLDHQFHYTSNTLEPTFPDGLDIEVFQFLSLKKAWENADLQHQMEHVTPYIYENREFFSLGSYKNDLDLSNLRWTVDEKVDYELVVKIYEALYCSETIFTIHDILNYLDENQELKNLNKHIGRNEGYNHSLLEIKKEG